MLGSYKTVLVRNDNRLQLDYVAVIRKWWFYYFGELYLNEY